jgi:hypothetical protein
MTERFLAELTNAALEDFTRMFLTDPSEWDTQEISVEVAPKPHVPRALPAGKMAVYCFFLNEQALKVGIAGPKSGARYRSQHYNPNSARSTLARSILDHPKRIGVPVILSGSIGKWIKEHTDRINILLPALYGRSVLCRLESFLHMRWNPVYEGVVVGSITSAELG